MHSNFVSYLTRDLMLSDEGAKMFALAFVLGEHALLSGPSGVGKTRAVELISEKSSLLFRRIQMVSDLFSSDVLGTEIFRNGQFEIRRGPIFSQIVLIDEINRGSPRFFSALLEALSDGCVTIAGERLPLPEGFRVYATQNDFDDIGVGPLPSALLDRFALSLTLGYPTAEDEVDFLRNKSQTFADTYEYDLSAINTEIRSIYTSDALLYYIRDLVSYTRGESSRSLIISPLSLRSSKAIKVFAQGRAYLAGRVYVLPEDVAYVFPYIVSHRLTPLAIYSLPEIEAWRGSYIANILSQVPIASREHSAYFDANIERK